MSPDRGVSKVGGGAGRRLRPRVVILDTGVEPRVEVLELPENADLGSSFDHCGTSWRITGQRTASRVLIAEPRR